MGNRDGPASDSVAREMIDLEGETRTDDGPEDEREVGFDAPPNNAAQLDGFGGGGGFGGAASVVAAGAWTSGGGIDVDDDDLRASSATEPNTKPFPVFLSAPILAISSSFTPAAKTTFFPLAFPFPFAVSLGASSLTSTFSVRTVFGMAALIDEL